MLILLGVEMTKPWWMPEHPDAMYGAALGGAIALLTALFTNRNARKRQAQDLAHSTAEKERDRQYTLRREIYLPLVEASNSAVAFVCQTPTAPLEQLKNQEPLFHLGRLMARLGLIAPPPVQESVQKAHMLLMQLSFMLINERWAIEAVSSDISTIDFEIQLRLNRQKELNLRMEKHIDEKTAEESLMRHLHEQHKVANEEVTSLLARKAPLVRQKLDLELRLQKKAVDCIPEIAVASGEALIMIRKDLGMPTDEHWIRESTAANNAQYGAAVRKFQEDFRAKLLPNSNENGPQ